MNIMSRYALRLAGIGAFAIAFPQFGSASDSENGAAFKLAMGPISAALANQGQPTSSDATVPIPKPRARHKHKNMRS
jgi:hypothetical protein